MKTLDDIINARARNFVGLHFERMAGELWELIEDSAPGIMDSRVGTAEYLRYTLNRHHGTTEAFNANEGIVKRAADVVAGFMRDAATTEIVTAALEKLENRS